MVEKISIDDSMAGLFTYLNGLPDNINAENGRKVAIISVPRSGSSLFCSLLQETNKVGYPLEWICKGFMEGYARHLEVGNFEVASYLDFIAKKTTTDNGVFSVHFHVDQYIELLDSGYDIFSLGFDKIYYVYRKEKIDQAYSYAKALITNQWASHLEVVTKIDQKISISQVLSALVTISKSEEFYDKNLKDRVDREYCYEDFSFLETTTAYGEVLNDLEIFDHNSLLKTYMKKQSTSSDQAEIMKIKEYLYPNF